MTRAPSLGFFLHGRCFFRVDDELDQGRGPDLALLCLGFWALFISNPANCIVRQVQQMDIIQLAEQGDQSGVIHLLEERADPNTANEEGWSPLIMASKGGHTSLVKELLSRKASPNPTKIAHTALRAASIHGHSDILRCSLLSPNSLHLQSWSHSQYHSQPD